MADRTLTGSDGTRSRHSGSWLRTAAPRRLLLRLHLRGNQLRIRQRVSIFPQGTLYVSILSYYIHHVNSHFQQTHLSILQKNIVLRSVLRKSGENVNRFIILFIIHVPCLLTNIKSYNYKGYNHIYINDDGY